jgi:hypothetical protein
MGAGHGTTNRRKALEAAKRLQSMVLTGGGTDKEYEDYFDNQFQDDVRLLIAAARLEIARDAISGRLTCSPASAIRDDLARDMASA